MLKVGAYCRVSTDKDDQANSFESQQKYFREYIGRNPEWELAQIFADEGISGTSTKKRKEFNRMIRLAKAGEMDLIITKEVSRFARNTVDTLQYTRDLKKIGVVLKRALYFICCNGKMMYRTKIEEDYITRNLLDTDQKRPPQPDFIDGREVTFKQLSLFDDVTSAGMLPTPVQAGLLRQAGG